MSKLKLKDPDVYQAIQEEYNRQTNQIELIASENITSPEVMEVVGSVFTNKYAEGYPGKRYYGGCQYADQVESLAISRAKELFGAEYANVQPHSGSQANMGVYFACLKPGDKILGMDLAHGGHLTHGSPVNFSGQFYEVAFYGVNRETEQIDMEEVFRIAREERPKMIVAGASAYPRELDFAVFRRIADEIDALLLVDMAHIAGLIAAEVHPTPVPHAQFVTSTTHKTMRGPRGGLILAGEEYGKKLNSQIFPGIQGGPLIHIIAAKAVSFKDAMNDRFKNYQQQVVRNAQALGRALNDLGFRIVSGGTDNHLLLIDLNNKNISGKETEDVLEQAGITVNKNAVPFDSRSRFVTSGIRLGTPATTTRGMKEKEMEQIAEWINRAVENKENKKELDAINREIRGFCSGFPLHAGFE
ncbi:MAG: serine hydroxymethyltransferase [Thermodesulfobacteriota bacterium]